MHSNAHSIIQRHFFITSYTSIEQRNVDWSNYHHSLSKECLYLTQLCISFNSTMYLSDCEASVSSAKRHSQNFESVYESPLFLPHVSHLQHLWTPLVVEEVVQVRSFSDVKLSLPFPNQLTLTVVCHHYHALHLKNRIIKHNLTYLAFLPFNHVPSIHRNSVMAYYALLFCSINSG